MDNWQTLDTFWNSFGLPAYDEQTAFTDKQEPAYPHITYQSANGIMWQEMTLNASLWYKSTTWKDISEKASQIQAALAYGKMIKTDGGFLWIKMPNTTPFAQRAASGSDDEKIKRIVLTIEAESLSW